MTDRHMRMAPPPRPRDPPFDPIEFHDSGPHGCLIWALIGGLLILFTAYLFARFG